MIIRCNRLYNPNTKTFYAGTSDGYTTIGNLYSVLEIYYDRNEVAYRVFCDGDNYYGHPVLVRSDDFEVVTSILPHNWELYRHDAFHATLGPKIWNIFEPWEESFWQDFDNNLPKARECFDNELRIIFEADPEYIKIIDAQQNRKPYFE